ncbi:MAG: hypothetical protein ACQEP3_00845 [Patescibacteria group bacterium]
MKKRNKKGSILYFSVLLVGVLFSAGIAVTTVLIQRIGMIEELSYSTSAFYAADAGIEKALYRWSDIVEGEENEVVIYEEAQGSPLDPEQSYILRKSTTTEDGVNRLVITSVGNYRGVKRGIQISRPID